MRYSFLLILSILFFNTIYGQVTFVVNDLPENHDYNNSIYISGEFEGWTGGHEDFKLQQTDSIYAITIPVKEETTLFKFTLGSWQTVERDANGEQIDNRVYKRKKGIDTIYVKIESWEGNDAANKSSAAKNVSIVNEKFFIPELNRDRRVWVYLPPGYNDSSESYPVLYMHDGQNLFDTSTSYSGEWEVDETLNKLFSLNNFKLIVVGIDNGGEKRLDEYSPWKNEKYGGGEGEAYMDFIVNTLKPYIDKNYRTLANRKHTGIMGSSMGGLISHFGALKHPEIFGKAGVYSPAFWFAPEVNGFSKTKGNLKDTKLYFLAGGKEGIDNTTFKAISRTAKDMNTIIDVLKNQGFTSKNIKSKVVPEGKHNEELWRNNFEEAILWLFPEAKQPVRTFVSAAHEKENQLNVKVSDGDYSITFYNEDIIETTFIPKDQKFKEASHAVIMQPESLTTNFQDNSNTIEFTSNGISVIVEKSPFKISYEFKGKEITSEINGYRKIDDLETIQLSLTDDEVLYGTGARALGMNRRGHRLRLYNRAHYGYETESELMNFTLPIVASSKQYMVHFDNAPIGYIDLDSNNHNTLTYETISGRKTYQVIAGDSWFDIMDNYTNLTGKQPMLPRWALGNFSSRFGYHSQEETEATINKFKEEEIPVDAIILDLYWFGKNLKGTMGNLDVYRDSFPDFEGMVKRLNSKGVKTITITEPFIVSTSNRWQEAVDKNILAKDSIGNPAQYEFYFGNTGIIDIYKPEAEQWFWNIYKGLANKGVAGVWGDLGEPEVHPKWVQHLTGSANEVHNTFGHDWARLVYEGYGKDFPKVRPFILMRAGYSGSQRYGMIPWSGDVNRTWGGLQSQPEIALQMGMQGLGYMHSDLGGFAGANLDDELYVRWLQYGVFNPIFRPHAQEEVPSEPVFRSEKAKKLAKEAIELRYRLLPYNYNMVYENHKKGWPLMRPLFFEEADNPQLSEYSNSYLWGDDILVSPILEAETKEQDLYLPKANVWFDFYTDEKVEGGQTKTFQLKENTIPTFVRAGSFIPMAKVVQTTKDYNPNELQLHYYHDDSIIEIEREIYNDDGITKNPSEYELLEFEAETEKRILNFEFEKEEGSLISNKTIELIVHNAKKAPRKVKADGKKVDFTYDDSKNTLKIPISWNTSKEKNIKIKFNK